MPMERPFGWWFLAESAARHLTIGADVERSDTDVERLVTGSSLFAIVCSVVEKTGRAWPESRTSRWLRTIVHDLAPPSMVERLRIAGLIVIVGALTALVLQALEPMRTGRLDSVLPAVVAVAGALVFTGARPLAHALADRRP
jgi:hypothetical protein